MAMVSWLFYDSVAAWLLLMPVVAYFLKDKERFACLNRKRKLEIDCLDVRAHFSVPEHQVLFPPPPLSPETGISPV